MASRQYVEHGFKACQIITIYSFISFFFRLTSLIDETIALRYIYSHPDVYNGVKWLKISLIFSDIYRAINPSRFLAVGGWKT